VITGTDKIMAAFSGLNRRVAIEHDWFLLLDPANQRRITSENLVMLPTSSPLNAVNRRRDWSLLLDPANQRRITSENLVMLPTSRVH